MAKVVSIWLGGALAVAMVAVALWAWGLPPELGVESAGQPYVAKLGIRSLAVALIMGAQAVVIGFVVARVYPARTLDRVVGVGAAVASFAALGVAIVLALSSR